MKLLTLHDRHKKVEKAGHAISSDFLLVCINSSLVSASFCACLRVAGGASSRLIASEVILAEALALAGSELGGSFDLIKLGVDTLGRLLGALWAVDNVGLVSDLNLEKYVVVDTLEHVEP